jgi:hypothetical protein
MIILNYKTLSMYKKKKRPTIQIYCYFQIFFLNVLNIFNFKSPTMN